MRPTALFAIAMALCAIVSLAPATAARPAAADGRDLWFAPFPYGIPAAPFQEDYGAYDFQELFEHPEQWPDALAGVDVIKLYTGWLTSVSDADLQTAVDFMKAHDIEIAVEVLALRYDTVCGFGVEGFAPDPVGLATTVIDRIRAAGGTVRYLALQEPLTFASSVYTGPNACNWPIEKIASEVKSFVSAMRAKYPAVVIGDIENDHPTPEQQFAFMDAFEAATGQPFAFYHLDIDWTLRSDWPFRAKAVEEGAHTRGIEFGLLTYGADGASNDERWLLDSLDHVARYTGMAGGLPDDVIFQSWHEYPRYLLPESEPGTYTWLLRDYLAAGPSLALTVTGGLGATQRTATATLRDAAGAPLANETVRLVAKRLDGPGSFQQYTATGIVPAGATSAVVGYRANSECNCSPERVDVLLRGVSYRENGGEERVPNSMFADGIGGWYPWGASTLTAGGMRIAPDRAHDGGMNSPAFPATAGVPFEVSFDARVGPQSTGGGYFVLVFLGDTELSRVRIPFDPVAPTVTAVTDTQGVATVTFSGLANARYEFDAVAQPEGSLVPVYAAAVRFLPPAPVIASVAPVQFPSTAAATDLVVRGSAFFADSTVLIDGVPRATTYVSATELRVRLDIVDTWRPGLREVRVETAAPGGGLTDMRSYTVEPVPGRTFIAVPNLAQSPD